MPHEVHIGEQKKLIKSYLSGTYNIELDKFSNVDIYLDTNLRNILALKIWQELLEEKLPSGPDQYLDEIISNFNQIIILGLVGFKIPTYMLIRRSIENLVSFIYYKDHNIEFLKKEHDSENQKPHPEGWGMLWAALTRNLGFREFRNHLIFVAPVSVIYTIEALLSVFPESP